MLSKAPSSEKMAKFFTSTNPLSLYKKKQLHNCIEMINQQLFQKRCAPQRKIEEIKLVKKNTPYYFSIKIVTELRLEIYVCYGTFQIPITLKELQSQSDSRGNSIKIEYDE